MIFGLWLSVGNKKQIKEEIIIKMNEEIEEEIKENNKWIKINELKDKGIYSLIMSYPNNDISRSSKHQLCEWLMKQRGEIE
jgi:hypothetical protein